jgi:hypothetical protein
MKVHRPVPKDQRRNGLPRVIEDPKLPQHTLGRWLPQGLIRISPAQDEQERLDTLIHEAIHEAFYFLREEAVVVGADTISRILWREGYRRTYQDKRPRRLLDK